MSRAFQLQLVRKTLGELGYQDVAETLAQRMASENGARGGNYAANPLSELISAGEYNKACEYLTQYERDESDGFRFGTDLHTDRDELSDIQRAVALYLVLRTSFLERILSIALGDASPSGAIDAFKFLQERVSVAFDAMTKIGEKTPFVAKLTKEQESAVLLPLTMVPPTRAQLESSFFTPAVLLTNVKGSIDAPEDDYACLTRLRSSLTALLRQAVGIAHFNRTESSLFKYGDIPDDSLADIIHKAALYNESQALYHLPPRSLRAQEGLAAEYSIASSGTRDDLPIHLLHTLTHHTDEVWYTRFSPSGRFLATGSLDGTCMIFDVADSFRLLAELDPNAEDETAVFVSGSYIPPLDKKKGVIYFSWEPHERYIVTCCLDTVIRIWNIENIVPKRRVTRSMNGSDSAELVSCFTLGERMRTWPCEFLKYDKSATPHFIVGSPDKALKVFSIDGNEVLDFYSDADEWSSILGDDASHTSGASTDPPESSLGIREPTQSHVSSEESNESASQFNRINDFAITPNGRVLITANNDKQVFFYRIPDLFDPSTTTSRIASLSLNGRLTSCNISANGRYMLLSIAPEELQLWDISPLETNEKPFLKQKFLGQSQAVYMVRSCFGYLTTTNMKEELVLSGSDDGYIYIWKLDTGQLITRVKGHEGLCNSVDWNRFYPAKAGKDYGKYWCSVGDDQLIKIWGPRDMHAKPTAQ
ncbi:hypothetical protein OXX69_006719 [Metschnikowia pulcherrima]